MALQVGTLSKGIGALGGYVACSQDMRDFLLQRARPVLFSTSHPPSVVATCIAALEVLEEDSSLVERLWEKMFRVDMGVRKQGTAAYALSALDIGPTSFGSWNLGDE